ncbi:uncharacterized protein LOC102080282 isoform X3 [Oreochromis niloticus]|uniref:uncharacterized protein LOC102080282 isoform X3 n=1 Tax=Oreochromis niloticus TaxID=8128 RepID=UPI0009046E08|nr:uncharacterized protein LOC102080282 isoform X3 [Oreochromis niloticus]XP_039453875.1 uncharacterized protein LOC120432778 isoform X1 [Oreochromis aureus]CAI5651999.1 unnamed protein product [Mustela putorius furo]
MKAVVGLLVLLVRVSHGVETYCDGRQDGAQCFGVLGGSVDIQLMNGTSEIPKYQYLKNSLVLLHVSAKHVLSNTIGHRSLISPSNGTFRINNLSRNDSGDYTLQTFDSDARSTGKRTLHLFIQAPVSSVLLVSECLSQGERRVSCSSEGGDSPQYSWTLDGRTLTDAELFSENNETNIITLKQHVSGRLVCSVRNNVSNVSKEEMISTCGFIFINCTSVNGTQISGWVHAANITLCIKPTTQPTRDPTMITQTAVTEGTDRVPIEKPTDILSPPFSRSQLWYITLLILLVVGVAVIWAQRKKQNNKPTKQKDEEDDEEVTYADVRFMKHREKEMEQKSEEEVEVEYGQVKFSKRPLYTEPTEDDCLYANVKKSDDLSNQCFYTYCTTE